MRIKVRSRKYLKDFVCKLLEMESLKSLVMINHTKKWTLIFTNKIFIIIQIKWHSLNIKNHIIFLIRILKQYISINFNPRKIRAWFQNSKLWNKEWISLGLSKIKKEIHFLIKINKIIMMIVVKEFILKTSIIT